MLSPNFNISEQIEFYVEQLITATTRQLTEQFSQYYFKLSTLLKESVRTQQESAKLYLAIADFTWNERLRFQYYHRAIQLSQQEEEIKDQIHLSMGLSHYHYGKKGLAKLHLERSKEIAIEKGHSEMIDRIDRSIRSLHLV